MAVEKKLQFKGAKEILFYPVDKKKKGKKDYKAFWTKLFGGYHLPVCPLCDVDMKLIRVHIERSVSVPAVFGGPPLPPYTHSGPELIELEFECPKCKARIKGFGKDITFDFNNDWFAVEVFGVQEYEMNIDDGS